MAMHPDRQAYLEEAPDHDDQGLTLDQLPIDNDYEIQVGPDSEKAANVLAGFKRRKIGERIPVPTDDTRVRQRLRELGEPITLFGEEKVHRRDRLRDLLVTLHIQEHGDEDVAVDIEMGDADDDDEDDQANKKQEDYTLGSDALLESRQKIAMYSITRAANRRKYQKLEATIPLRVHVKHRKAIKENLAQFDLFGSQIAADRPVSIVRFAPDGKSVAAGNWAGGIKILSVPDLEEKMVLRGHSERIGGIAWYSGTKLADSGMSEDVLQLASGGGEGNVHLWSLTSETPISTLSGHTERVCRVEFHPTGDYLASASYDTTWRLWDVNTSTCLLEQDGHSREVYTVAFNNDGSLIVSGGLDSVGRVWDLRSGRTVMILDSHIQPIYASEWNPDGYRVCTGSADGFIKVWDVRNVREQSNVGAHIGGVTDMRLFKGTDGPLSGVELQRDEDGQYVPKKSGTFMVSSGFDKKVNIFSADDWALCGSLSGHSGNVLSVDVDREGAWIVSGGHDRTVKIWGRDGQVI